MNLLIDTNMVETGKANRPAALYKFDTKKFKNLQKSGFSFDL